MPAVTRGIWAETAPREVLRDAATWRLLARHGLRVAIAVRPPDAACATEWAELGRAHGVSVAMWPMIEDGDGRWLSAANADTFGRFVREVTAAAPGVEVVLDLEPPFVLVRGALHGRRDAAAGLLSLARDTGERRAGLRAIEALCHEVRAGGAGLTLAVVPLVLFDGDRAGGWGRVLGAPWGLPATRVNVMLYTTLIEGYSKGIFRREDARALLSHGCGAAVVRLGERASVSLGAAGVGALGDEPAYPDPAALADDAAIALAAGARDMWLFDLGGILARSAPERWLAAFGAPALLGAPPRPTVRSRAALAALWAAGAGLGAGAG